MLAMHPRWLVGTLALALALALGLGIVAACAPGASGPSVVSPSATDGVADPFDRVVVIGRHRQPTPSEEVDALERELGFALPSGYRDFVTRFGEGDYADLFRVSTPAAIRAHLAEDRARWAKSWFFAGSEHLLTQREMADAVRVADTFDGDEFVAHPKRRDVVFVLPRDSDRIVTLPADLRGLTGWARRQEPIVFQPWSHQDRFEGGVHDFHLDDGMLVDRATARWGTGDGDVLVSWRDRQPGSWAVVAFVPRIGVRIQVISDDGRRQADRRPFLSIAVHGDEEGIPDVRRFFASLSTEGLMGPLVES
jgi:hypothetical protein